MNLNVCSKLVCKPNCCWWVKKKGWKVKPPQFEKKKGGKRGDMGQRGKKQARVSLVNSKLQKVVAALGEPILTARNSRGEDVELELQEEVLEPGWSKFIQSIFVGIFDPKIMAWIILISSYFFIFSPAIQDYQEKCPSPKKYVLNEGEIKGLYYKQVNETTITYTDLDSKTYYKECTDESNNLFEVISGIMIFMLTMALGSGLSKYQEILRMYEEISGDIKALAMMMVHLTYDAQKYTYRKEKVGENEEIKLEFKNDLVPRQYVKIKYLLSALPKVVVDTINNDGGNYGMRIIQPASDCGGQFIQSISECFRAGLCRCNRPTFTPFCGLSERSYVQLTPKDKWCYACCFGKRMRYPNYWKDYASNETDNRIGKVSLQHALYAKIREIHDVTKMDAFECVMTCLLDELQRLNESGLGFGADEGSAVVSCVLERWGLIYGTWGSLSSLKTYEEPWLVNVLRAALLFSYALLIPNRYKSYINEDDNIWFNMSILLCVVELGIFTLMWYLAYAIRNPFRPTLCIKGLQRTSLITQNQVVMFLGDQNFSAWDEQDYKNDSSYGWFKDMDGLKNKLEPLGLRKIPKFGFEENETKGRSESKKGGPQRRKPGGALSQKMEERKFVRFKNVNF